MHSMNEETYLITVLLNDPNSLFETDVFAIEVLNAVVSGSKISQTIVLYKDAVRFEEDQTVINVVTWLYKDQYDPCLKEIESVRIIDTWISPEQGFLRNINPFTIDRLKHTKKNEK